MQTRVFVSTKRQMCQPVCGAAAQDAAADPQHAERMSKLQADKAAADDRLAAVMADIQAFKQEAADSGAKSRADRKVNKLRLSPCWRTLPPSPPPYCVVE